jgi:hypothetical protein
MKISLFITLVLLGQIATGQTENHQKIAGTKCSLIPPEGFAIATNFSGFQNARSGASIMVTELPAPVQTISQSFTAGALKAKGMTLIDKQVIDFNGSKATFIKLSQPANGITYLKQILIFGDTKHTVLINGIYPEESKALEKTIKDALLSTIYNTSQNDNPLEAVTFIIDVRGTEFKLAKYMTGSLIYTTDGKIPTKKPSLIVGNSIAKVTSENQKQYCINRLKKLPGGELNVVKEINPITIDNLSGYEIVANGKNKDSKHELIYQTIVFTGNDDYFIIIGKATEDLEFNLQIFKTITKTFRRK